MGSVNPVFLLPGRLAAAAEEVATQYAGSLTLGVGQFCTNPGILVTPKNAELPRFLHTLKTQIGKVAPAQMMHPGIAASYHKNKADLLGQTGVDVLITVDAETPETHGNATVATVSAQTFLANPKLGEEVFGPFGLVVTYENHAEAVVIATQIQGPLTATALATPPTPHQHKEVI